MPSLLLLVFLLQLTIHLINTVGKDAITALAWLLYSKLPTSTSRDARRSAQLRNEVVRLKREMNATSAQDEFSKWAKLRRQHDKTMTEHEKVAADLKAFKSSFDSAVGILRWLSTNGLRFLMQTWYQRTPMFWIPRGLIPYYAEWIMSFPRAPVGAVSIQVWAGACAAVIILVSSALTAIWALMLQRSTGNYVKEEPMELKEQKAPSQATKQEKKEL